MVSIDIYHIGGEIGYGLSSQHEPLGVFAIAVNGTAEPYARVHVQSAAGCAQPCAAEIIQLFIQKCHHAMVGRTITANFGWLLSCAHYVRDKYACACNLIYEKEFLSTQLSGYGREFAEFGISRSMIAHLDRLRLHD